MSGTGWPLGGPPLGTLIRMSKVLPPGAQAFQTASLSMFLASCLTDLRVDILYEEEYVGVDVNCLIFPFIHHAEPTSALTFLETILACWKGPWAGVRGVCFRLLLYLLSRGNEGLRSEGLARSKRAQS